MATTLVIGGDYRCEQCGKWFCDPVAAWTKSIPLYCPDCEDYEDFMQDFGGEG